MAHFLCYGIPDEALGKGWVPRKEDESPVDWANEFANDIWVKKDLRQLIKAYALERRDGKSLLAFMDAPGHERGFVFRAFSRENYEIEYDEFGEISYVKATSKISGRSKDIDHYFGMKENEGVEKPDKGNGIKFVRELIFRPREDTNEGMSYLEPIWDVLMGLYFLRSHSAYAVAKAGAGQKKARYRDAENMVTNELSDEEIDTLLDNLAEFGSANDTIWEPPGVEIETMGDITKIDINAILEMYMTMISAYTGAPMQRIRGIVPGQQEGAVVNESSWFDLLRDFQELTDGTNMWYMDSLGELEDQYSDYETLDYNVREEMTETDELKLMRQKLELYSFATSIGMSPKVAMDVAKLDLKETDFNNEIEEKDEESTDNEDRKPQNEPNGGAAAKPPVAN